MSRSGLVRPFCLSKRSSVSSLLQEEKSAAEHHLLLQLRIFASPQWSNVREEGTLQGEEDFDYFYREAEERFYQAGL